MFIKNCYHFKVGDEVILTCDIEAIKGTIIKGSKVIITEITNRGYSIKDLESGEEIIECGYSL